MSKTVYFVSDFFKKDFPLGGAELTDHEVITGLENKGVSVEKINSRYLTPDVLKLLNKDKMFIFSNFMFLKNATIDILTSGEYRYMIYEHDHKYLVKRNPSNYVDYKCPKAEISHKKFYEKADAVYCQSNLHKMCIENNLDITATNMGASLWEDDFYDFVSNLEMEKFDKKVAVLETAVPHKSQKEAEEFCNSQNIQYDLVSAPSPRELITKLAKYDALVFFPKLTETFCRLAAEAKMVGCKVITNGRLGCASEEFFSWDNRKEIISFLKTRKQEIIDSFYELIPDKKITTVDNKESDTFKIVVPCYNAEKYIEKCITSIKSQTYKNFECIVLDDASTDNTTSVVNELISGDNRFSIITNDINVGVVHNTNAGIEKICTKPSDIVVIVDGDDWLSNQYSLELVSTKYKNSGCWMTYGSHEKWDGTSVPTRGEFCLSEVPSEVVENNSYRETRWMTSAMRTFRYGLWQKINPNDLKDLNGNFYRAGGELSYMFPMLEMSREKALYIRDMVYIYNLGTPTNDHNVNRQEQLQNESVIRSRKKYERLENYA